MPSMLTVAIVVVAVVAVLAILLTRSAPLSKVEEALAQGAKVVDVRSADEFREGHFPGSINVPVDQISARLDELGDPEKTIVLYCHSGMRSGSAIHIVRSGGFKKAINGGALHRMMQLAEKSP
jgi:phage shock protein E